MKQLQIKAPAKINLTLDVTGRRPNGYHDLRMVMQTIDLCDELEIQLTDSPQITLSVDKELPGITAPEENLAYRAARLMQQQYSLPNGFQIHLAKKIPAAAGLGGGSSDCAAVLLGINELCGLSLPQEELCRLGLTLGADVPFCIQKGTMLAEGIGEVLTPLPALAPLWVLLVKPDFPINTGYIYANLDLNHLKFHPDTDKTINAISRQDTATLGQTLSNVLETVAFADYPVLNDIKSFLLQNGSAGALMSGSGPTVYGLYKDETIAYTAFGKARGQFPDYEIYLCQAKVPS